MAASTRRQYPGAAGRGGRGAPGRAPNAVMIYRDDLGYGGAGCHGFSIRTALLTGRYPVRPVSRVYCFHRITAVMAGRPETVRQAHGTNLAKKPALIPAGTVNRPAVQ